MIRFCEKCGAKNESESNFCESCGSQLEDVRGSDLRNIGMDEDISKSESHEPVKEKNKLGMIIGIVFLAIAAVMAIYYMLNKKADNTSNIPPEVRDIIDNSSIKLGKYDGYIAYGYPESPDDMIEYVTENALDIWAVLQVDTSTNKLFFDVYEDETYENAIMSFFIIDKGDGTFTIDKEDINDTWFLYEDITNDNVDQIINDFEVTKYGDGDYLIFGFLEEEDDRGIGFTMAIRIEGSVWDSEIDVVPPRFR